MAKFNKLKQAQKLYVQENKTLGEIGIELDLSRRTLFYWKKKYEWDRKRFEAEHNQEVFSNELFDFARKLMQKISRDMDNKTPAPQSEIYSLMKILKNIPQVKQYEHSNQKSKQPKPTGQLTTEIIDKIEREIFGL